MSRPSEEEEVKAAERDVRLAQAGVNRVNWLISNYGKHADLLSVQRYAYKNLARSEEACDRIQAKLRVTVEGR